MTSPRVYKSQVDSKAYFSFHFMFYISNIYVNLQVWRNCNPGIWEGTQCLWGHHRTICSMLFGNRQLVGSTGYSVLANIKLVYGTVCTMFFARGIDVARVFGR